MLNYFKEKKQLEKILEGQNRMLAELELNQDTLGIKVLKIMQQNSIRRFKECHPILTYFWRGK